MATYTIDKRPTRLKYDDLITFNVKGKEYGYEVKGSYLEVIGPEGNDIIFTELGLDKVEFCRKHYGEEHVKEPLGGDWPELQEDNYAALCRVVNALYDTMPNIRAVMVYETPDGQRFNTDTEALEHMKEVEVETTFLNWCTGVGLEECWAKDILTSWKVAQR